MYPEYSVSTRSGTTVSINEDEAAAAAAPKGLWQAIVQKVFKASLTHRNSANNNQTQATPRQRNHSRRAAHRASYRGILHGRWRERNLESGGAGRSRNSSAIPSPSSAQRIARVMSCRITE